MPAVHNKSMKLRVHTHLLETYKRTLLPFDSELSILTISFDKRDNNDSNNTNNNLHQEMVISLYFGPL